MSACRVLRAVMVLCLSLAVLSCDSEKRTVPTAPAPRPAALRIAGVPPALSPGGTTQLKAELVFADGLVKECASGWSVDDPRVATVTPGGLMTGGLTGFVRVTATCDGLLATAETRTSALSTYQWIIVAHDSEVLTESGVAATVEFLDGPRAGERMPIGSVFTNGTPGTEWPVRVRLTARDFATTDAVLAETTGKRRNSNSPLFDFRIPMVFASDSDTDTYIRRMSRTESEIAHPFEVKRSGTVEIRTWWSVDYNDRLFVDLWCGGTRISGVTQQFGSAGSGLSQTVGGPASCEVRLRQAKSDASTHYRVAIRYPR